MKLMGLKGQLSVALLGVSIVFKEGAKQQSNCPESGFHRKFEPRETAISLERSQLQDSQVVELGSPLPIAVVVSLDKSAEAEISISVSNHHFSFRIRSRLEI